MPSDGPSQSLMPREHGAYGQLLVPAAAALAAGPTIAGFALVAASIAVFLMHEPVLVLLGHRGGRARAQLGDEAKRRLVSLAALTVIACGITAFFSPAAIVACAPPAVVGAVVGALVVKKSEKTLSGEILAAAALSGVSFPVWIAADGSLLEATELWAAWAIGFAAATAAVRFVIGVHKRKTDHACTVVLLLASGIATAMWFFGGTIAAVQAPVIVTAWALALVRPHPRRLRSVGWMLVAATFTTGLLVFATLSPALPP